MRESLVGPTIQQHGNVSKRNFESIRHGVSSYDVVLCMEYITVLEESCGESEIDDQSTAGAKIKFYVFCNDIGNEKN